MVLQYEDILLLLLMYFFILIWNGKGINGLNSKCHSKEIGSFLHDTAIFENCLGKKYQKYKFETTLIDLNLKMDYMIILLK